MDGTRCFQVQMWTSALLLVLSQLVQRGQAEVLVQVQPGPIYRVIDHPLSISCNATGFAQDAHFEYLFFKPNKPNQEIRIISTKDPGFAYAMFSQRVSKKDITLERLSATSALFHITKLQDSDDGVYECHSPNPVDEDYLGTYSAKITVKVIKDTLTISSMNPAPMTVSEGVTLTLQCLASSNTVQHTHLSLTWYFQGHGETSPTPIISLNRDLMVSPGVRFEGRYQAGLIGLEKVGEATYTLRMAQLQVSDTGSIYCQAQEWIQEPDRSWYAITQKDAEKTALEVKAKEVTSTQGSVAVHVSTPQAELQEGEELAVVCRVEVQGQAAHFFSLSWFRDGVELAGIGPTGVLTFGPEYSGRQSGGELRATRTGEREHLLTLRPVRAQDQGGYLCRVWAEEGDGSGVFTKGASQDSGVQPISISATQSGLSVAMETNDGSIKEGDRLQLICRVTGFKGRLSVSWQHRSATTNRFTDVITLSQDGVMETGVEFGQRGVSALRPTPSDFTLQLSDVTPGDAGNYQCTVSEWTTETNGNAKKTHSQSQQCTVSVTPIEALLKVKLYSRDSSVAEGGSAELQCQVKGPRLPVTVTWSHRHADASSPDTILTVAHNNDITWGGDQSSYQLRTVTKSDSVLYVLRIEAASQREAGQYQCLISAFLQNTHRKQLISNFLGFRVQPPVSKLSLAVSPANQEHLVNTDVQMTCSALGVTSESSRLAVTWFVEATAGTNRTLLSSDRDGVVTLETSEGMGSRQPISMQRGKMSFELTIRQARIGDSGRYRCVVTEWLQDAHNQWYALAPPSSAVTELLVKETVSDFEVDQTDLQLQVREGQDVELNCTLTSGASDPVHLYALNWFHTGALPSAARVPLVVLERGGALRYPGNHQRTRALHFSRPSESSFLLGWRRAAEEDSGAYACLVEQYQLNTEGGWEIRASDTSGTTNLTVRRPVSRLSLAVSPANQEHLVNTDVQMTCSALGVTSESSRLAVTWFVEATAGTNRTLLSSDRDGVVTLETSEGMGSRQPISMQRGKMSFELTIQQARIGDSGRYRCVVTEWLQDAHNQWYALAPPSSAVTELLVKETGSDFRVDQTDLQLQVREGQDVELNCTLTSGASDPVHLYALTWFHIGALPSAARVPLVVLERGGALRYPGNHQRTRALHFSRPSESSFRLGWRRAAEEDSGAYACLVEQYQLNTEGGWEIRASDTSGSTNLTVRRPESNLQVLKQDRHLNLTMKPPAFDISCNITSRTSQTSELQVTWFSRRATGGEGDATLPIFRAHRDFTLHDLKRPGHRLSFGRPSPSLYALAVTMATPSDSSVYHCEVEEWLQSPSLTWRRVAQDRSGDLTVSVHAEGAVQSVSGLECLSGTILGVLLPVVCVLALVVVVLVWRLKGQPQSRNKKQANSLWAEENPLKTQPIDLDSLPGPLDLD